MEMDVRKIVVVVEDDAAARKALQWGLQNLLRRGDVITLLHVFTAPSRLSKKKTRLLRLRGYHLALSFRLDISTSSFFNANTEIIVKEGDRDGSTIAAVVREIGASALLVGLHDNSFLHRLAMVQNDTPSSFFNCKVLAIKQPASSSLSSPLSYNYKANATTPGSSTSLDFSQIDISGLLIPEAVAPTKVAYRICPSPHAIIWRTRPRKTRKDSVS